MTQGTDLERARADDTKKAVRVAAYPGQKVKKVAVAHQEDNWLKLTLQETFMLAAVNSSSGLNFTDFARFHKQVLAFCGNKLVPNDASTDAVTKEFRQRDQDHDQSLSFEEFVTYMEALLKAVGRDYFEKMCKSLLENQDLRRAKQPGEGYDLALSQKLLRDARQLSLTDPENQQALLSLIEQRADPNFQSDKAGNSVLIIAVNKSSPEFMLRLLNARADPNVRTKGLDCAAFRAARERNMAALQVLIFPHKRNEQTALKVVQNKRTLLSQDLVRNMVNKTGDEVKALAMQRADINFKDDSGWTPLTIAVLNGKTDCCEALIKTQSPVAGYLHLNKMNPWGRCPLHTAARKGYTDIVNLLIQSNANPDVRDNILWTPLHHAAFNGQDGAVQALLEKQANPLLKGRYGLSPYLASKLPSRLGNLDPQTIILLEPSSHVSFSKGILPILKTGDPLWNKIKALLSLPGVKQDPINLQLHNQLFDPKHGPNKVRLMKIWELLAEPLIRRMRSGEADMEPLPPNASEEDIEEWQFELEARRKTQKNFLTQWLDDTRGLRPTPDWTHENRLGYRELMQTSLAEQLANFEIDRTKVWKDSMALDGGDELMALPVDEVFDRSLLSHLCVHAIPTWLEQLDAAATIEALREVGAAEMGLSDDEALAIIPELLTLPFDYRTGTLFWRNVYRLWLCAYAKMADAEYQKRIQNIVEKFNEKYEQSGFSVRYVQGPAKTLERMKGQVHQFRETSAAPPSDSYADRTLDAVLHLDAIRALIVCSSTRTAVMLYNEFFRTLNFGEADQDLKIVRCLNRFSPEADVSKGFRNLNMNLEFNMGKVATACGRPGRTVDLRIIGEVRIMLESFIDIVQKRALIVKAVRGEFDWQQDRDDFNKGFQDDDDE